MGPQPNVHHLRGIRGGNVYLIEEEALTLVDCGLPGSGRLVFKALRVLGRQPEELKRILITHGHPDHYGGAVEVKAETGARVLAHPGDVSPGPEGELRLAYSWVPFFPSTPVDGLLKEDQSLPVLGGLRVLHTPGHTPGSVCFYAPERGLLFTGDTLLSDGRFLHPPFPFPGTSRPDYYRSLAHLAAYAFEAAYVGHGTPCQEQASLRTQQLLELYRTRGPLWWRVLRNVPGCSRLGRFLLAQEP